MLKNNIKLLDCTLRDGGYVNNWDFKKNNIIKIINNLIDAKIDFVECGFLKNETSDSEKSLYSSIEELEEVLDLVKSGAKFTVMINYGEFGATETIKTKYKNLFFRIAFKKKDKKEALEFVKKLVDDGNKVFVNPMNTNSYSSNEFLDLINSVNQIKPYAFTIVDTFGAMKEKDVLSMFYVAESTLDKDIKLCFHSHNNLQLSFSNTSKLLNAVNQRELIIDSTVFGIGRGAGNLATELIVQYLNDNFNTEYDIIPILKTLHEQINPIFLKSPWGYSVHYYLAAKNLCHPNYAKYLIDKKTVAVEVINNILQAIPPDKKASFDKDLIEKILENNKIVSN